MFEGWQDFYLMIGSAAAALIGLMFVVVTLTSGMSERRATRGQELYMTPTVANMGAVFVLSATAMAPRAIPGIVAALVAAVALAGVIYKARTAIGLVKPNATEHWNDFWLYAIAPLGCYAALAIAAMLINARASLAPEALAAALTTLLLVAIRNAWDLVTWIAPRVDQYKEQAEQESSKPEPPTSDA